MNNCCINHLMLITKKQKGYQIECLYCSRKKMYDNKKEIINCHDYYGDSIYLDEINKNHLGPYDEKDIKIMVFKITINYPYLSNKMIINRLNMELFTIDLTQLLLKTKKTSNFINIYLQRKINFVNKQIHELNTSFLEEEKKPREKIKCKI